MSKCSVPDRQQSRHRNIYHKRDEISDQQSDVTLDAAISPYLAVDFAETAHSEDTNK